MTGTRRFVRVVVGNHYEFVRAGTADGGAATSPVVSAPRAPVVASSHRTTTRPASGPIATPCGLTTRFSSPI